MAYVYRKGYTIRSPYCALRYVKNREGTYRVAVVVSKKVSKAATNRNRIRRRTYEAIRILADRYLKDQDIIVTIFDDRFLTLPHTEIVETLERQLRQLR